MIRSTILEKQDVRQLILVADDPVKTTESLIKWSKGKSNVFGILMPTINGVRYFMDIHTREQFEMERKESGGQVIVIGKNLFDKKAYDRARQITRDGMRNTGWIVFDGAGKAELDYKGFYQVLRDAIDNQSAGQQILIVTQGEFVRGLQKEFGLAEAVVVDELN